MEKQSNFGQKAIPPCKPNRKIVNSRSVQPQTLGSGKYPAGNKATDTCGDGQECEPLPAVPE